MEDIKVIENEIISAILKLQNLNERPSLQAIFNVVKHYNSDCIIDDFNQVVNLIDMIKNSVRRTSMRLGIYSISERSFSILKSGTYPKNGS